MRFVSTRYFFEKLERSFTDTFAMATGFLIVCTLGAVLIPHGRATRRRTALAVAAD